jgi:hypothetical protein
MQRETIGDLSAHNARVHAKSRTPGRDKTIEFDDDDDDASVFPARATLASHSHVPLDCTCLCWIMVLLAYTLVRVDVSNPMFLRHPSLTFILLVLT